MVLISVLLVLHANPVVADCDDEAACRKACVAGDVGQCQALGDLVVADDRAEALKLYELACGKGLFSSCSKWAYRLAEHSSSKADVAKAMKLSDQACSGGDALGCANLAVWLWDAGPSSYARAAAAAAKACKLGDSVGCGTLGSMYLEGVGVAKSATKALEAFEAGCDGQSTSACTLLAVALLDGSVGKVDAKRAVKLLTGACDDDYAQACSQLSDLTRRGVGVRRRDRTQALVLLQKACRLGSEEACERSGLTGEDADDGDAEGVATGGRK